MCRILTLEGKSPPSKKGDQAVKDIKNGFAWLDMRQARAIWLKRNVRGADIKLNKIGKAWEEHNSAPKGQRDADSSIVLEQWTIVLLLSKLSHPINVPRGSLYSFPKGY